MDWMLATVELWLEVTEAERDWGGEVAGDVDAEVGAREDRSLGGCDPVAGTVASGLPRLCSSGVGAKWTSLLVEGNPAGGASVLLTSVFKGGLVTASSLPSVGS